MYYKIENEFLTCEIDDMGAQLHSLILKENGKEYIWQGNPEIWYGQAPVLFPIIGQLIGDKYRYNGKEYTMPKHGLARKLPFAVKECGGAKAVFSLESDENTLKSYPFEFELLVIFELCGKSLVNTMTVINKTDGEMYFSIGAHPGFPDLMGFGRRNMNVTPAEAKAYVTYQLGALYGFCRSKGVKLQHVKPHGALYNMAGKDAKLAEAIVEAVYEFDSDIILLGLSGSEMIRAAQRKGLRCANEFFADRGYEEDGSLVDRRKEGAMITDEDFAVKRLVRVIKENKIATVTGKDIDMKIDSVCVHGDGAKALAFVEKIRQKLADEGIAVVPLSEMV